MLARIFKIRDRRIFLHFHDEFVESEHPRKHGEFTKKGTGGEGTGTTSKTTKATLKKTPRVARGQATAGFLPLSQAEGKKEFTLPGGKPLPKHIAHLKIPPKWTNVRYNPDPKGSLIVVGYDSKGKQQPKYSEKHIASQAAYKFDRARRLEPKYAGIMAKNTKLQSDKDPKVRDAASILALIMHTGMRPSSEKDTGADYKSYGATTLEGQHVITDEDGNTILRFVSGKHKGKPIDMKVTDPDLAKNLQQRAKQVGEGSQLFPTANERFLLNHVKKLAGAEFKTKDFRTLLGTRTAGAEVKNMPVPKTPAEYKKFVVAVATKVSDLLGNTPKIALEDYIAPHVFADWKLASGA